MGQGQDRAIQTITPKQTKTPKVQNDDPNIIDLPTIIFKFNLNAHMRAFNRVDPENPQANKSMRMSLNLPDNLQNDMLEMGKVVGHAKCKGNTSSPCVLRPSSLVPHPGGV